MPTPTPTPIPRTKFQKFREYWVPRALLTWIVLEIFFVLLYSTVLAGDPFTALGAAFLAYYTLGGILVTLAVTILLEFVHSRHTDSLWTWIKVRLPKRKQKEVPEVPDTPESLRKTADEARKAAAQLRAAALAATDPTEAKKHEENAVIVIRAAEDCEKKADKLEQDELLIKLGIKH